MINKDELALVDWDKIFELHERESADPPPWSPPMVLPPAWEMVEQDHLTGAKYKAKSRNLVAIISCSRELDGRHWLHLSVSHRQRIPTWDEMRWCKEVFLGDREAYQVMPPKARYVNIMPNVLHMFALLDGAAVLPDFTQGTNSL